MTTLLRRVARAVASPGRAAASLRARLHGRASAPPSPATYPHARRLAKRSRALGVQQLLVIMSFDCDTPEDAEATQRLHPRLTELGIKATYAVPGAQLRQAGDAYRAIAGRGAAFINHGGRPHAAREGSRYVSITDYATLSEDEVIADVVEGDRIFREVIGRAPEGFRAPHFGSYCRPEQLAVLHECARRLGYRFCSTTLPELAHAEGPAFRRDDVWEFPLSGSLGAPDVILDSWNYLSDRERYVLREEYFAEFRTTVDFFLEEHLPAVLNFYVDPAHVVDNPPFHRAMEHLAARGVPTLFFNELIALIEGRTAA